MMHHPFIKREKATYWVTNMNVVINSTICNSTRKAQRILVHWSKDIFNKKWTSQLFTKVWSGGNMQRTNKLGKWIICDRDGTEVRSHPHVGWQWGWEGVLKVDNDLQVVMSTFFFKSNWDIFLLADKGIQRHYHYIAYSPCNQEFKGTQCGKDVQQKQAHVVTLYNMKN